MNDWNPLTIFAERFILDVYVGFEYVSTPLLTWIRIERLCSVCNWASQLCPWKLWKILSSVFFTERHPLPAVRKLNVHKIFRRPSWRLMYTQFLYCVRRYWFQRYLGNLLFARKLLTKHQRKYFEVLMGKPSEKLV